MADPAAIDEPRLKALGARGMVRPGGDALQVVLGPIADQVAGEIRDSMRQGAAPPAANADATEVWLDALGGADNVLDLQYRSSRLIARVADPDRVDEEALKKLGARAVTRTENGGVQILLDPAAGNPLGA
jgi:PTS system N-acetylglucosamine-specific IIC component